jgi:hypothetical protein
VVDNLKTRILDATKQNICGKVTELVKGSVVVYSIKIMAVEIGLHKFHNNQEPARSEA